jgi:hypothetical protein
MRLLPVWRTHPAYSEARTRHQALERNHYEARSRANAKARHFETRSKRISLRGAVLRMNIYGIIAWLKAALIYGWLGTPVLNPELARDADRQRRAGRKTKYEFVQHNVRLARLRAGDVGGGRVPHRAREANHRPAERPPAPTHRHTDAAHRAASAWSHSPHRRNFYARNAATGAVTAVIGTRAPPGAVPGPAGPNRRTVAGTAAIAEEGLEPPTRGL